MGPAWGSVASSLAATGVCQRCSGFRAADLIARAAGAARDTVNRAVSSVESRCATMAASRIGAVRPLGRADQGLVHLVAVGDGCLPTALWITHCGWAFGSSRHVRACETQATCSKCIAWAKIKGEGCRRSGPPFGSAAMRSSGVDGDPDLEASLNALTCDARDDPRRERSKKKRDY